MNPNTTKNPRTTFFVAVSFVFLFAVVLAPPHMSYAQELQKGVSVQMPHTTTAIAYPAADNADAVVVAVAEDGKLYVGNKPVTPDELAQEIKLTPRTPDARLYIKADSRASFAFVKGVLGPASSAHFEEVVLLTSQPAPRAGAIVPPRGLDVLLGAPVGGQTVFVRLSSSSNGSTLTVNDKRVSWSELESTLKGFTQTRIVQVEANDAVPFADVIRVIDEARAAGASVALPIFHWL
jgi:biopolymer transport protein ExbD